MSTNKHTRHVKGIDVPLTESTVKAVFHVHQSCPNGQFVLVCPDLEVGIISENCSFLAQPTFMSYAKASGILCGVRAMSTVPPCLM